jgi:YidC/Oxa1 family membrane protein insertase
MEQRSPSTFPLSNFILFMVLSLGILVGYPLVMARLRPQQPQVAEVQKEKEKDKEKTAKTPAKGAEAKPPAGKAEAKPETPAEKPPAKAEAPPEKPPAKPAAEKVDRQWVTLGSADPKDRYRMLVTLDNQGAALARIELSSPRYRDLEDRTGYLGHIVMVDDGRAGGCPVQVVGAGTPAAQAGLKAGDRITAVNGRKVNGYSDFHEAMADAKPGQTIELTAKRLKEELKLTAKLIRRPLETVRPETRQPQQFVPETRPLDPVYPADNDPLSLLATLQQFDDEKIAEDEDAQKDLGRELQGVDLRSGNWKVVESDQDHAVFRRTLPERGLEISKTYRLVKIPAESQADSNYRAYDLQFEIQVKNIGDKAHTVAYRLDGPNGLPCEGAWYASKVSFTWGAAGLRDVVLQRAHTNVDMISCTTIADKGTIPLPSSDRPFVFVGVDSQYFSGIMLPDEETSSEIDHAVALRLGDVDPQRKTTTNTTFRLASKPRELAPGKALTSRFMLFTGPKKPALLAEYGLDDIITYGWYGFVARPMTWILERFHDLWVPYGLGIILLTVLVRGCMFPFSRKQALNAQKMQELQPEIKRLQEKYKDPQARMKAQQELFRKHNYNPLSGCLVLFIQLPIFIGLYRSLQVNIELRDAPLISHAIRWCSNLAAPDMLINWYPFMHPSISSGIGIFGLGPYFNLLPILTIVLFIVQQKMFMPPAADEQAAMQQKIMQYMMIFMGLLFYKVAAGLCIYFIASSLWGVAERKILPKTAGARADDGTDRQASARTPRLAVPSGRDGTADRKKKRGKR